MSLGIMVDSPSDGKMCGGSRSAKRKAEHGSSMRTRLVRQISTFHTRSDEKEKSSQPTTGLRMPRDQVHPFSTHRLPRLPPTCRACCRRGQRVGEVEGRRRGWWVGSSSVLRDGRS